MKKIIPDVARSIRRQGRARESVIAVCQQVRGATLSMRNSLKTFKIPLSERGDTDAVRVIDELENLADLAYARVTDRLTRLNLSMGFVDLVEPPLQIKDRTDSTWTPSTWTGVHAELLTFVVKSIEVCRSALSSIGVTLDHVTRYMLVKVLTLFEEMLYVAEMNPPKASTELPSLGRRSITEVQTVGDIEQQSCALMTCSPTSTLKVVSGTLELSQVNGGSAWFVPRADAMGRHIRLDKQINRRLIDVHPERQPLFQGCAHIIELRDAELQDLDYRLKEYIIRPLEDSGAPTERSAVNGS